MQGELAHGHELREGDGADQQRGVHAERGMQGLLEHLAEHTR